MLWEGTNETYPIILLHQEAYLMNHENVDDDLQKANFEVFGGCLDLANEYVERAEC